MRSGPDVIVADLEEFTSPADRPAARARIVTLMAECRARGIVGAVRINKLMATDWTISRAMLAPRGIFLPHRNGCPPGARPANHRAGTRARLAPRQTEIVLTLESARGIVATAAIRGASTRVSACLLAAEDRARIRARCAADGIELHAVRARFLVECSAAGCVPVDCPFNARTQRRWRPTWPGRAGSD
ncbi:aldolase/citrate lyase family protein [Cupriavidus basilensis]